MKIVRDTLPSGVRLVLLPRSDGQAVTFMVLIGVGSRYETITQWGLSHFLEHMFFKGTTTRPDTQQIAEAIDRVGGEFNAFTSEEVTAYHVTVAQEHFERAADVVSDILLRPLFASEEIERERGVITEEIRMYTSMPQAHVRHLWNQAVWGDHPLGRRIDGSEESVASFDRSHFLAYTKAHYHAGTTVVAVAGKFDEGLVRQRISELFSPLPVHTKTLVAIPFAADRPAQRMVIEQRAELNQVHLVLGVPGVSVRDERRWAVDLLAAVLGGGMSSRLFLSIRERHGLAYTVRTSAQQFTDTGDLSTYAGVRVDSADKAGALILQEYDRVMQEPVGVDELTKVKEMVYGHLMLELEDTQTMAVAAGSDELFLGRPLTPQEIKERLFAVTADQLQRVAQELLVPRVRAVAVLGPGSGNAWQKLLTT